VSTNSDDLDLSNSIVGLGEASIDKALESVEDKEKPKTKKEGGEESKIKEPKAPWFDLNSVNFIEDTKQLFRKPLTIIIFVLAVLFLTLFIMMLLEFKHQQDLDKLRGYVLTKKVVPDWYKDKLPKDLEEFLHDQKLKRKKIAEQYKLVKEDPRLDLPFLGDKHPGKLKNEEIFAILKTQDVGQINPIEVEKPENMNLSGIDMTAFDYTYFKVFVAADMRGSDFSGVKTCDLNFRGASLQYSQFVASDLPKTNFIRSHLSYANFYQAKMLYALFQNATARNVQMTEANFTNANFAESAFLDCDFSKAILDRINAYRSHFEGTFFNEASLVNANFRKAKLVGASFRYCNLAGVNFEDADLTAVDFTGANLQGVNFKNADITEANFKDVVNVEFQQLAATQYLRSARNIDRAMIPKKLSWKERYIVPNDTAKR
jgi:uncharacterized protein YjbI with pentapeptide repeats